MKFRKLSYDDCPFESYKSRFAAFAQSLLPVFVRVKIPQTRRISRGFRRPTRQYIILRYKILQTTQDSSKLVSMSINKLIKPRIDLLRRYSMINVTFEI